MSEKDDLHALWEAAVAAALPDGKFAGRLPARPEGRTLVLGAGKASARMAAAFEDAWGPCEGLVVTRYGHGYPTRFVEVAEAAHPVPDQAGLDASARIFDLARSAGPDDLVVFLISGGASALLVRPAGGLTLAEKQAVNAALLRSGAPIDAMNEVRRCLSGIKGGQLATAAAPAAVVTYLISDVPGDDPAVIGSGPTIIAPAAPERVLAILAAYRIPVSPTLESAIRANGARAAASTATGPVHMLATPLMALQAAAAAAQHRGVVPVILGDALEGEAREAGLLLGGIARSIVEHGLPVPAPVVLLSGGETTVTVRGEGRGGRNTEFLLALLKSIGGLAQVSAIACDTDGIDGIEDNAGAWFDGGSAAKAKVLGLEPASYLARNDAYSFFAGLDQLVQSGATHTNVNDFRAIIVRSQTAR